MWIPNPSGEQPALSQFHMKYSKEQCLSCFLFSSSLQPATSSPSASPGRCWGTNPSACSKSHTSASVRSVHLACHFRSYQRRWKRWHACRHALTSPTSAGITSAAGHGAHAGQGDTTRAVHRNAVPGPGVGTGRPWAAGLRPPPTRCQHGRWVGALGSAGHSHGAGGAAPSGFCSFEVSF